jgi:hypothetical protein
MKKELFEEEKVKVQKNPRILKKTFFLSKDEITVKQNCLFKLSCCLATPRKEFKMTSMIQHKKLKILFVNKIDHF